VLFSVCVGSLNAVAPAINQQEYKQALGDRQDCSRKCASPWLVWI